MTKSISVCVHVKVRACVCVHPCVRVCVCVAEGSVPSDGRDVKRDG